jgi:hypothetical protein
MANLKIQIKIYPLKVKGKSFPCALAPRHEDVLDNGDKAPHILNHVIRWR